MEPFKVVAMKDRKPAARAFADFLFRELRPAHRRDGAAFPAVIDTIP